MSTLQGGPNIIRDGLVFYLDAANYKSYPESGTIWTDLTKENNDGILTNGPTFDSTNKGNIVFDGVDDKVVVANNNVLNFVKEFTVSMWVKPTAEANINLGILDKYNASGTGTGYLIDIPNGSGGTPTYTFRFTNCVAGSKYELLDDRPFDADVWSNLICTYDGSNINIYDGVMLKNFTTVTGNNDICTDDLMIGGDGVSTNYFLGSIANVLLYNRALTLQEIQQNYSAVQNRFTQ